MTWVAVSAVCFGVAGLVAAQDPVPAWELSLTEWINRAPDWVGRGLWPVMQLGAAASPLVLAVGAVSVRRPRLAAAITVSGVTAWFAAKGVKQLFGRGRPLEYLPSITLREGDGTGLGFVSGHSAVAAACAVCVATAFPPRWRPLPVALAAVVGLARIVHGVHLPADVVGGWALGTALGLGAVRLIGTDRPQVCS